MYQIFSPSDTSSCTTATVSSVSITTSLNQPAPAPYAPNQDCFLPDNGGYIDDSLEITIERSFWTDDIVQVETQEEGVTAVQVVRVKLTDASQFRTALAGKYPSKQVARVEQMAQRNNAVLAINGDFIKYPDIINNKAILESHRKTIFTHSGFSNNFSAIPLALHT